MKPQLKVIDVKDAMPEKFRLITLPEVLLHLDSVKFTLQSSSGVAFDKGYIYQKETRQIEDQRHYMIESKLGDTNIQSRLVVKQTENTEEFDLIKPTQNIPEGYRLVRKEDVWDGMSLNAKLDSQSKISLEDGHFTCIFIPTTIATMFNKTYHISKEDNSHCKKRLVVKGIPEVTKPYDLITRPYYEGIPAGYRMMSFEEIQTCVHEVQAILQRFQRVAFLQGSISLLKESGVMDYQIQLLDFNRYEKRLLIQGEVELTNPLYYKISKFEEDIPKGYRWMNYQEVRQCLKDLMPILSPEQFLAHQTGYLNYLGVEQHKRYLIISDDSNIQKVRQSETARIALQISLIRCLKMPDNYIIKPQVKVLPNFEFLKISVQQQIPDGYRQITYKEAQSCIELLKPMLQQWDVVLFSKGRKILGSGYKIKDNNDRQTAKDTEQQEITKDYPAKCLFKFIIKNNVEIQTHFRKYPIEYVYDQSKYRLVTYIEALSYRELLKPIIEKWDIVALETGKISGSGYGYMIDRESNNKCGFQFSEYIEPKKEQTRSDVYLPLLTTRSDTNLRIVSLKKSLKVDQYWLTCTEARKYLQQIKPILNQFDSVALEDGQIYGQYNGFQIQPLNDDGCTERLIKQGTATPYYIMKSNTLRKSKLVQSKIKIPYVPKYISKKQRELEGTSESKVKLKQVRDEEEERRKQRLKLYGGRI